MWALASGKLLSASVGGFILPAPTWEPCNPYSCLGTGGDGLIPLLFRSKNVSSSCFMRKELKYKSSFWGGYLWIFVLSGNLKNFFESKSYFSVALAVKFRLAPHLWAPCCLGLFIVLITDSTYHVHLNSNGFLSWTLYIKAVLCDCLSLNSWDVSLASWLLISSKRKNKPWKSYSEDESSAAGQRWLWAQQNQLMVSLPGLSIFEWMYPRVKNVMPHKQERGSTVSLSFDAKFGAFLVLSSLTCVVASV